MKIPEQAKKVFDWKIFDVYQWKQEMFDWSFKTFEWLKWPNAAEIIAINEKWKFIITHEEQLWRKPFYSLVAWRIEDWEDELVWAKRELLEETWMISNDWKLLRIYNPSSKIERNYYIYLAKNCKLVEKQNLDSWEKIEVLEVDFDQFIEIIANPKFRNQEFKLEVLEYFYKWWKEEIIKQFNLK